MNDIKIREMRRDEVSQFKTWLKAHAHVSQPDYKVFEKCQVKVFVAEDESGVQCYIPVRYVYNYQSIAPRPDIASFRLARIFQEMTEHLKKEAARENIGAVIAQPSDPKFAEFLQMELGFRVAPEVLYMDLNELEIAACAK